MSGPLTVILAIATVLIALYGAVLSTYTFIVQRRAKRREVRPAIGYGFLTRGSELSEHMLFVTVTNPGDRTVRIYSPGILLPDRRTIVWPEPRSDVRFPYDLHEGKNCRIWCPCEEIARELASLGFRGKVPLVPFVEDAVGNRHMGPKSKFDLDKAPADAWPT